MGSSKQRTANVSLIGSAFNGRRMDGWMDDDILTLSSHRHLTSFLPLKRASVINSSGVFCFPALKWKKEN